MPARTSSRRAAVAIWMRAARIFRLLDDLGDRMLRGHGLSSRRFDVLAQLRLEEGISQAELASSLVVTKGGVSQLVSSMEAEGLLRREQEGRRMLLRLTERGRALAARAVPEEEELLASSLRGLSAGELKELSRLLRKWEASIKEPRS
jgi:DNA-binding MarR family transcriptional regulator